MLSYNCPVYTLIVFICAFLIIKHFIGSMEKMKLEISENYDLEELFSAISTDIHFKGTWIDRSQSITKTVPFFKQNNGIATLKISQYEKIEEFVTQYLTKAT